MHLLQALRNQATAIKADIANSNLFAHMGERGSHRESAVRDFLRPFLPDCYGLSSGEVFSADGSQSTQVDLVIYDAIFSAVLFKNGPHQLFPAESVFGTDMLDFTPLARLNIDNSFTTGETLPRNPYATFVFGLRGSSAETITRNLNKRIASNLPGKLLLPDFIFVADPDYMICRSSGSLETESRLVPPGAYFNRFVYLPAGADALPLFF